MQFVLVVWSFTLVIPDPHWSLCIDAKVGKKKRFTWMI